MYGFDVFAAMSLNIRFSGMWRRARVCRIPTFPGNTVSSHLGVKMSNDFLDIYNF
jgi:hypothetical protein